MLCTKCKKNEATVHYQEIINGKKKEYNLCQDCANQMKLFSFDPFDLDPLWLTPNLFRETSVTCPHCGLSLDRFSKEGKFGCQDCYRAFSDQVPSLLNRIHGHSRHVGKIPKRGGGALRVKTQLESLHSQMDKAVAEQNFEQSAQLRDEIKRLEGGEQA